MTPKEHGREVPLPSADEKAAKERARKKYKALRSNLTPARASGAAKKIAAEFLRLPQVKKAGTVGLYMSKGSEVDTSPILRKLLASKKKVSIPRTDLKKTSLRFFRIEGLKDCRPGFFNILEPRPGCRPVLSSEMDLVVVPGIAFDRKGWRIGYGKGFYDKFLNASPRLFSIGLSYARTLARSLPHGRLDRRVHCVVTEKGAILPGGPKKKLI